MKFESWAFEIFPICVYFWWLRKCDPKIVFLCVCVWRFCVFCCVCFANKQLKWVLIELTWMWFFLFVLCDFLMCFDCWEIVRKEKGEFTGLLFSQFTLRICGWESLNEGVKNWGFRVFCCEYFIIFPLNSLREL